MRIVDEVDNEAANAELIGAHRELLKRVISSATFGRAERLSSLLTYICEQSFKGRADDLSEQHVGEAVFGRPRGYDCSIDSSVRTQASRLRQRLTTYFEGEGLSEPIRIVVPPGGYVPIFEPRLPMPTQESSTAVVPSLPPAAPVLLPSTTPYTAFIAVLALTTLCLLASWIVLMKTHPKPEMPQSLFWSGLFPDAKQTLVVPGDSSLVIWQGLMHRDLTLPEYVRGSYLDAGPSAMSQTAADLGSRRYTSIVDLNVVKTLALLAQQRNSSLNVRYARDVRPNDLKRGNVILIGAFEANPWVRLFEPNMNFILTLERSKKRYIVQNRRPQTSEPAEWILADSNAGDHTRFPVFALVAYVPNLDGQGNVLILEGETMAGTECAWDFVSDEANFLPFLKTIGSAGGAVPHFEVLLSTQNMSGSATRGSILAFRTHP